ncbi:hypothetical protein P7C71_g6175, partial [Lecanoromycetidae sp. Uapishka_2]
MSQYPIRSATHSLDGKHHSRLFKRPAQSKPTDSVIAAPNPFLGHYAHDLPVFLWIHGGGYGIGDAATYDHSILINTANKGYIGISIQYRLGAFGFLSSQDVHDHGVVNAGLLDQHFALEWVQEHICKFGGDPGRVTVGGQSAGGGSVMLQAMAYGGTQGTRLFNNIIAESPYLPMQHAYNSQFAEMNYEKFAQQVDCNGTADVFGCLVAADTIVLQNASSEVTANGELIPSYGERNGTNEIKAPYGTWPYLPITDGTLVQDVPSRQLLEQKVNGIRILTG